MNELKRYEYEPGNGTRYDLLVGRAPDISEEANARLHIFVWLNAFGGGRAMTWSGGYLSADYFVEKMFGGQAVNRFNQNNRRSADYKALLDFLSDLGFDVEKLVDPLAASDQAVG